LATTASNGRPHFQQELLAIPEDPEVKSLARRTARNPAVAEDALQTAYYAVCSAANPDDPQRAPPFRPGNPILSKKQGRWVAPQRP
jgi:hypothetical protein